MEAYKSLSEIGEHPKKIAVIDAIPCINPHDSWKKGGQREFEKLEGTSAGVDKWLEFMKKNKIRFNGKDAGACETCWRHSSF